MSLPKKDSIINMVLVLTLTCVISGLCLSYTFNLTKDTIASAEREVKLSAVRTVLPPFDGDIEEKALIIDGEKKECYLARRNGEPVGLAIESHALGYGGSVSILVGVTADGTISGVQLLKHQETPGLGAKAGSGSFLKQFIGKTISNGSDELKVVKDDGDIQAITAATITSRAVAKAASNVLQIFLEHKEEVFEQ